MSTKFLVSTAVTVLSITSSCYALTAKNNNSDVRPAQKTFCVATTKTQIAELFDRWEKSLLTKNPDVVANNYDNDAVLLPTLSNFPRTTHEGIREYFKEFLEKSPRGVIDTRQIKLLCNEAYDVGTYTFYLTDHGEPKTVHARYSFIYHYHDGKWLIAHHHSSLMPESNPKE
jgi:uncharacterized protein (TIGR02246 family)